MQNSKSKFLICMTLLLLSGCKLFTPPKAEVQDASTRARAERLSIPSKCYRRSPLKDEIKNFLSEATARPAQEQTAPQSAQKRPTDSSNQPQLNPVFNPVRLYELYVNNHLGKIYTLLQHALISHGHALNADSGLTLCLSLLQYGMSLVGTPDVVNSEVLRQIQDIPTQSNTVKIVTVKQMANGIIQDNVIDLPLNKVPKGAGADRNPTGGPTLNDPSKGTPTKIPQPNPGSTLTKKFNFPIREFEARVAAYSSTQNIPFSGVLDIIRLPEITERYLVAVRSTSNSVKFFVYSYYPLLRDPYVLSKALVSIGDEKAPIRVQDIKSSVLKLTGLLDFKFAENSVKSIRRGAHEIIFTGANLEVKLPIAIHKYDPRKGDNLAVALLQDTSQLNLVLLPVDLNYNPELETKISPP